MKDRYCVVWKSINKFVETHLQIVVRSPSVLHMYLKKRRINERTKTFSFDKRRVDFVVVSTAAATAAAAAAVRRVCWKNIPSLYQQRLIAARLTIKAWSIARRYRIATRGRRPHIGLRCGQTSISVTAAVDWRSFVIVASSRLR